jgi:hypothetical protein
MKRLVLLPFFLVLANSVFGLAQVTVKITVTHANKTVSTYTGTDATVGDACGKAFSDATLTPQGTTSLSPGDVVQLPAVASCNIKGHPVTDGLDWPSDLQIVGMGPKLTTLNPSDGLALSGVNQVFQDLTMEFGKSCCTDGAALGASPTSSGSFTLKNVNLTTELRCNGPGGISIGSGNVLLDHVNLASATNAIYVGATGKVTVRNSTVSTFCDSALGGGGVVDVYDSLITNSADIDDSTLYPMGKVNLYAGASVVAAPGSRAIGCSGVAIVNIYPGAHITGSIDKKGDCSINTVPPKK